MLRERVVFGVGHKKLVLGVILCGVLVMALSVASLAQSGAASRASGQTLAGAWNATIVPDDPAIVGCTSPGLNTRDGGVVAQGCDISESPGYGQWLRIGNREFAVTFVGVNFGPAGAGIVATYKVRATVRLSEDAQTFSGPFLTEVFALDGTLLAAVTGTVTSRRVGVEPL